MGLRDCGKGLAMWPPERACPAANAAARLASASAASALAASWSGPRPASTHMRRIAAVVATCIRSSSTDPGGPEGRRVRRVGRARRMHGGGEPSINLGRIGASSRHVVIGAGTPLGLGLGLDLGHLSGQGCSDRRLAPRGALSLLRTGARCGGGSPGARPARAPWGRPSAAIVADRLGRRRTRATRSRTGITAMCNRRHSSAARSSSSGRSSGSVGHGHPGEPRPVPGTRARPCEGQRLPRP